MRVTSNTYSENLVRQLNTLSQRQNQLQSQVATGQRVTQPEDDPAAMRRVLGLQIEASQVAQYKSNVATLQAQAKISYQGIRSFQAINDRAQEIATLADGTKSSAELAAYTAEVNQLLKQALQAGNTQYQGEFLFAGTQTSQAPFSATFDAEGDITDVAFHGNSNVNQVEIAPNITLAVQAPGVNATGSGPWGLVADPRSGADLFQHLISLRDHLRHGQVDQIASTDRANLAKDEDNLLYHLGSSGAIQARLATAESSLSQRSLDLDQSISRDADVDLAETLVRFNQTQTAYKAALQSSATVLNQSLLDFLR